MKKLKFLKLWLISDKEKKARSFKFSETKNAIIGNNKVGKSTLLKTLYYTMGAEVTYESEWVDAGVSSLLEFKLDDKKFFIFRRRSNYAVFDSQKELLGYFTSIGKGLGPFLAKLFDFHLKLENRGKKGELTTPAPAFQYLPFFINQEKGWTNAWSSFERLEQFDYKKKIADYHTGVKPNKYYILSQKIDTITKKINELDKDKKATLNAMQRYQKEHPQHTFQIDINSFKEEINQLLAEANTLNEVQEKYRRKLLEYNNKENSFANQIEILNASIKELAKDHEYALKISDHHGHEDIPCPLCGTEFENSFVSRFSIVDDIEVCKNAIFDFNSEINEIKKKINDVKKELRQNSEQYERINNLLNEKKEAIALNDLISSEGRKETIKAFTSTVNSYSLEIGKLLSEQKDLDKDRKKTVSKEKAESIKDTFSSKIENYRKFLDLPKKTVKEDNLNGKFDATGSEKPRALLAYYYGILSTIKEHSSFCYFPIVIDSPNQQDQDDKHLPKIFEFIDSKQPSGTQLILGSVKLHGEDFDGDILELSDERSLLKKDEYNDISVFFSGFTEQLLKTSK